MSTELNGEGEVASGIVLQRAILTVSALSSTASAGIVLLAIYALGPGIPFLLSAALPITSCSA
jgi:cytochrome c biogenesis protein CcdA